MAQNIIEVLEQEEIARLNKQIPAFGPGDTVAVSVTATTPAFRSMKVS